MNPQSYEVWDTDTGNLVGAFATESEALAFAALLVETYGPGYAADLTLAHEGPDGMPASEPLSGTALLACIEATTAPVR